MSHKPTQKSVASHRMSARVCESRIAAFVCVTDEAYNILLQTIREKQKGKEEMRLQRTMVDRV
jgi:hypothetical protein